MNLNEKEVGMKKYLSLGLLSLFLFSLFAPTGFSQTAQEVLEKMIDAQGGRKVLESIKDTTLVGTAEMIQMGMNGSFTMYQKEPNKMRWDFEVMGMTVTQAFDGEKAWWLNPQTGVTEEMPEKVTQSLKRQALGNDSLLNPEKYGITFTLKGKEKIQDKDYLVLEETFQDGNKATLYLDPSTYLLYKMKMMTVDQTGNEIETENIFDDYKKVGDTVIAHSMTIFQSGAEFIRMTYTQVTFNSGLEDSLFQMK